MMSLLRRALPALAAVGALLTSLDCAHAATPARDPDMKIRVLALEMPVSRITLPVSAGSPVVMPSCGDCALKSFPTSASTIYRRDRVSITLGELKALTLQYPQSVLTVSYTVATGEIASITINPPSR
jgi:hypothetical protein